MKKIFFLATIYCFLFVSCGHKHTHDHTEEDQEHVHDHSEEGHEHHHDHEGHSENEKSAAPLGLIVFTKQQASKIDFETAAPVSEYLGQVIKTTAQITSDQTDETVVVARTAGIIVISGNIVEGKNVSSGQELFSVSGSGMAENNINVRLTEAQSNYTKAEADYLRAQDLAKDKIVSEKELLQIKSEYETTKAVYDNLYKNFSGKGQRVTSPTAGFVKQLYVSNGQYVEAGQPLVSISKNKSLLLIADVQSRYAQQLPFIVSANIRKPNNAVTYTLEELNGKILSFGKSVNENNYLIPVSFQIDNKAGFIPGSFVEIFIKTKSEKPVLSVPRESLVENQGSFFVFIQMTPESYQKREVRTGVTDGIRTEITSGLTSEDVIVTKGAMSVKLAESAGTLDPHAGHVH